MEKEIINKKFEIIGNKFHEIDDESISYVQGSGNHESCNISEHTFAEKVLMKGGSVSGT